MKRRRRLTTLVLAIITILLGFTRLTSAQNTPSSAPTTRDIDNNVSQRRVTWKAIAQEKPEDQVDRIVPQLANGLKDPDAEVAALAASAAARIAAATNKLGPAKQSQTALTQSVEIRDGLISVASKSGIETQRLAIPAMVASWPADDEIYQCMMRILQTGTTDPSVREVIIASLPKLVATDERQDELRAIVLDALAHQAPEVRGAAANAISKLKGGGPPKALPRLVEMLRTEDPSVLQYVIKAIGSYGPEARPYLPALRDALEKSQGAGETEQVLQLLIRDAIRKIESSR